MKIRVQQSDLWVSLLQAMGANATPMPYGEVYTALKVGTVDGAENNWPSYDTSRHFEVAKYYAMTEHSMAPEMLLMSKKVWDTLTPDEQKIFRDAAKESVPYMRKLWDEKEAEVARPRCKAGGAQVIEVDKKSFQDVMAPVYDKFMTTPEAEADGQGGPGHQVDRLGSTARGCTLRAASRRKAAAMFTRFNAALAKFCMIVAVIGLLVIVVVRADPGVRPLRPQRHADLGRGAGAGAGALGHDARRRGRRPRRGPHRHGVAAGLGRRKSAAASSRSSSTCCPRCSAR